MKPLPPSLGALFVSPLAPSNIIKSVGELFDACDDWKHSPCRYQDDDPREFWSIGLAGPVAELVIDHWRGQYGLGVTMCPDSLSCVMTDHPGEIMLRTNADLELMLSALEGVTIVCEHEDIRSDGEKAGYAWEDQ